MIKQPIIGGQAVIEGVMMRSPHYLAISVRKPDKTIVTKEEKINSILDRYPVLKKPLIRGIVNLFEMLALGIKALTFSVNESSGEDDEKLSRTEIFFTILLSMSMTVVFFIILPLVITRLFIKTGFLFNVLDGIFRIIIIFIYLLAISLMKDIRIVFQYHGAEHKSVNCYEKKKPLTVEYAKKFSTQHPRCGTSFMIIVMVISIIVFSFITSPTWYIKLISRIILLPIIAGVSYEVLKLSSKYQKNFLLKIFMIPGMWVQRITTKEPTSEQLEVALQSLKNVLAKEKKLA